jgi:hypothetical protein
MRAQHNLAVVFPAPLVEDGRIWQGRFLHAAYHSSIGGLGHRPSWSERTLLTTCAWFELRLEILARQGRTGSLTPAQTDEEQSIRQMLQSIRQMLPRASVHLADTLPRNSVHLADATAHSADTTLDAPVHLADTVSDAPVHLPDAAGYLDGDT